MLYFSKCALFFKTILNRHNKSPQIYAFDIYGVNAVFIPICHVRAVKDGNSSKIIWLWLHDTVLTYHKLHIALQTEGYSTLLFLFKSELFFLGGRAFCWSNLWIYESNTMYCFTTIVNLLYSLVCGINQITGLFMMERLYQKILEYIIILYWWYISCIIAQA